MIAELPGYEVCGEAANGNEALQQVVAARPDVILLDIRMPPPDGVEVARHLRQLDQPPAVIFCTAFDQYALPAFEAAAIDYLLKPVRRQRLEAALARATRPTSAQLRQLAAVAPAEREHLAVRSHRGVALVPLDDIRCMVAEDKYVTLVHGDGEEIIDKPLQALEREYADRFLRVHRNALIAPRYLAALERVGHGRYVVRLHGTARPIEVSRRQLPELRRLLAGH